MDALHVQGLLNPAAAKTELSVCQRARIHWVKVWILQEKKCRGTVYPRKCLSQLHPIQAAAWHGGMLWKERPASHTEVFKRKGVIKHKASALQFCSGIADLIPKYHPREDSLGSGVVYIKVSLVKSKGGVERASCSILQPHRSPQGCAGKRDACGYVLLKAHARTPPGAFWPPRLLFFGLCRQLGSV